MDIKSVLSLCVCRDGLILTDIYSPYKFESPWYAFEFAFHVLEVRANMVIISMAWLTREDPQTFSQFPQQPDMWVSFASLSMEGD